MVPSRHKRVKVPVVYGLQTPPSEIGQHPERDLPLMHINSVTWSMQQPRPGSGNARRAGCCWILAHRCQRAVPCRSFRF